MSSADPNLVVATQDAIWGMLNSRYDDLKSGPVQPTDGDEGFRRLRQRSESRRE